MIMLKIGEEEKEGKESTDERGKEKERRNEGEGMGEKKRRGKCEDKEKRKEFKGFTVKMALKDIGREPPKEPPDVSHWKRNKSV